MEIKILGPGCPRCEDLYNSVVEVLRELGFSASVQKIKDLGQIAAYGVLQTPALIINGRLIVQGRPLSKEEIKEILKT
ncbi:thioredoxin family protein [Thermosulfuriphilus sp.]